MIQFSGIMFFTPEFLWTRSFHGQFNSKLSSAYYYYYGNISVARLLVAPSSVIPEEEGNYSNSHSHWVRQSGLKLTLCSCGRAVCKLIPQLSSWPASYSYSWTSPFPCAGCVSVTCVTFTIDPSSGFSTSSPPRRRLFLCIPNLLIHKSLAG